jgi:flagellar biosynthesis/type III secretory pathway protein FliH
LVKKCEPLAGYVEFVHIVRKKETELRKEKPETDRKAILEEAIAYGITYCKEHDILRKFFEELSMEEQNMLATEWDWNEAVRVSREEGREEGWEDGREDGIEEDRKWIMGLLEQANTVDELKRMIEAAPPLIGKTDKTITNGY